MTANVDALERLLANGQDTAVLRFSLGNAYLQTDPARAVLHLEQATALNPDYSAAWKLLGKAYAAASDVARARRAFEHGIRVAHDKGDVQAAKEMQIFLKRLNQPPA